MPSPHLIHYSESPLGMVLGGDDLVLGGDVGTVSRWNWTVKSQMVENTLGRSLHQLAGVLQRVAQLTGGALGRVSAEAPEGRPPTRRLVA